MRNHRINSFRKHYQARGEAVKLWEKAQPFLPYIRSVFRDHGLPKELCLLPMLESSFNPKAKSARAAGLWQFIVPTAKDMGLKVGSGMDQRYDWKKSTHAAAKYLSWLSKQFDGDWALVLAAYNLGPNALKREMGKQGQRSFWRLKLRKETSEYVPKFLALIQLAREHSLVIS